MSNKKVWFVTGASRGLGVEFVKAALAAGDAVVASGRDTDRVSKALGQSNDLLPARLDGAYAASKFGLEGWMESLQAELGPFGIHTTIVNPGFFRTELLTPESTDFAETSIDDYAERRAAQVDFWTSQNGQQAGDPAKLAHVVVTIASEEPPRRRFIAGAEAMATAERVVSELQADIGLNRERFVSLDLTEA